MKILVCGGRGYADGEFLQAQLDELRRDHHITHVIHGAAPGADCLAGNWGRLRGVQVVACPANWGYYGKFAGYKRNEAMAQLTPDLVVAFPGGSGTRSMVSIAEGHLIPVRMVTP